MIKVQVSGLSGFIANVRPMDAVAQVEIRKAVAENGAKQQAATEAECPRDTGYMASHTRLTFSEGGLTFNVGYSAEDFPETFYPPFVIFGTHRMAANNFLFRVHEMLTAQNTSRVGSALRRSFARFER